MSSAVRRLRVATALASCLLALPAFADSSLQTLPFAQDWSNAELITTSDIWTGVPGIEGFRGDGLAATTGTDPQTILAPDSPGVPDVNANQTNPNTFTTGGVTEFAVANPSVALTGSGTAQAPYLKIYLNTTGASEITVAYNLRDLDGSTDNSVQPVALQYRVGNSGNFINVPAAFVADASSGPSLATQVTAVSAQLPALADNQARVELRILTTNAVGNDEWIGIDDISITAGASPNALRINDVTVTEGNAGTVNADFTVSLTRAAGVGGVSFDIATADGTATTADNDYVAKALTSQTIAQGQTSYTFSVVVNGDATVESDEAFSANLSNVAGAVLADGVGAGTIGNDDFVLTPIHDIQGSTDFSPLNGSIVTTEGIVTARRFNNGFYLQTTDAEADANPATSQGIFVFTSSAPPATAAVGNRVRVRGTVVEFRSASAPNQLYLTELSSPTVTQLSTGNALPTPATITAAELNAAGPVTNLERFEGMRATLPSATVVAPNGGNISEAAATATSDGIFYVVPTGVARPFREAGITALSSAPLPPGVTPPVWDSNPERLQVRSRGQINALARSEDVGTVINGMVGVIDYGFGVYQLLPDVASPYEATGGALPTAVAAAALGETSIAGFNLLRFFDSVNDPAVGEPVLQPLAFANRLKKTSNAICLYLKTPDILGAVEVENLAALQALADAINTNVAGTCTRNPQYVAYLVEGNDVGGIDVGFLVSTAPLNSGKPRVSVQSVTQFGKDTLFTNANLTTELLNDRPPLVLSAVVNHPNGAAVPVTVIANHLRSLNDVDSTAPGSQGWATTGERVRAKRHAQAVYLANLVQGRQAANASERIVLVGDFNAFEFNDGLGDSMGTITGAPSADAATLVTGDGVDLVTPNLVNMTNRSAANDRYSYSFEGSAQTLDHILVNQALVTGAAALRTEHARINADFGNQYYGDFSTDPLTGQILTPMRVSDHDPVVLYIGDRAASSADVALSAVNQLAGYAFPGEATLQLRVTNRGIGAAFAPRISALMQGNGISSTGTGPAGWTCTSVRLSSSAVRVDCAFDGSYAPNRADVLQIRFWSTMATPIGIQVTSDAASLDPVPGNNTYGTKTYLSRGVSN